MLAGEVVGALPGERAGQRLDLLEGRDARGRREQSVADRVLTGALFPGGRAWAGASF